MNDPPRVLVMGDLCLDTVVETWLPKTWSRVAASGELLARGPIADQVGGTAYQFARRAVQFGLSPTVVGSVGEDAAGEIIGDVLAAAPFECRVQRSTTAPTARTLVAYDASGARHMFTSSVSANDALSSDFVRAGEFGPWDLIWISGLCLRSRSVPRFAAVIGAVAEARRSGALVVLDVVPHDFYRLFDALTEVAEILGGLDGVVTEANTARRMLGLGRQDEKQSVTMLSDTADALLKVTSLAIVRLRDGSKYHQLAASRSKLHASYSYPVPDGAALLGYGDLLAAEALRDYLEHRSAGGHE
ncbi:hypothetical protein AB0L53_06880 [Nonomuraea sp. NPDC052129]|uniref:carbohydrate kinase family protein n=1 Tax=Nonomuraea sp. NPDC052129 TaxID=3154651 RepID=UPI003441F28B